MPPNTTWVVPGAPLEEGKGWRIWYSRPGTGQFDPAPLRIELHGRSQAFSTRWDLLPAREGLDRRFGVLTVRLDDSHPGETYAITAPEAGTFQWRSLSNRIDQGATFFMCSCFWRNGDKEGFYGAAIAELTKKLRPDFKLLMGDQIYQDWPPPLGRDHIDHALRSYAGRYEEYWADAGYQRVLQSSPNLFVCDDHEFWNNFPERQIQLPWTWWEAGRSEVGRRAQDLYFLYQVSVNPTAKPYFELSAGGVSLFVSDSRSKRTSRKSPQPHFFDADQWLALEQWIDRLAGPGMLVLSQPLYQKDGSWKDYSLSNFKDDHARLCSLFERALSGDIADRRPHDILVLTGDIHTGRHCVGNISGLPESSVHELAASPASLIGPARPFAKGSRPPGKLKPAGRPYWTVIETETTGIPSTHNNVAAVTISRGMNERVRFDLELWRVRPYDTRSYWERLTGARRRESPMVSLFKKELQLR
jgi:hypothetical protein